MKSKHRVASLAATLAMCLVTVGVSAAVAPSAGAAGSNTLTVKAGEYTYKFSGSPKAGWTQINFENDGVEYHMMAILPLKKGVTVAQLTKAAESPDPSAFDPIVGKGQVFGAPTLPRSGRAVDDDHQAGRPGTTGCCASSRHRTVSRTSPTAWSRSSTSAAPSRT